METAGFLHLFAQSSNELEEKGNLSACFSYPREANEEDWGT